MQQLVLGKKIIKTENPAFVMGILNATPDSFYKESRGGFEKALELIKQGADILDIGGESTRPGFTEVSVDEEIKRIVPLIQAIRKESDIPISVDTRKYEVMKAAFENGADVLNDVSALEFDEKLGKLAAETEISVILMHNFFAIQNNENPQLYKKSVNKAFDNENDSIVGEVCQYLKARVDFALSFGVKKEKIILDPGIGFGKTFEQDLSLIKNTDKLCELGYPILMALSRKRCIGQMTSIDGELKSTGKRLSGTLAANLISVMKGARLIRVHDVEETVDTLKVLKYNI